MRSSLVLATFLATSAFAADAFAQDCDTAADGATDPANRCRLCEGGAWRFLPEHTVCEPTDVRCVDGSDGVGVYRNECVPAANDETVCAEVFKTTCPDGFVCAQDGTCGTTCATSADCVDGYECVASACQREDVMSPDAGAPDGGAPDGGVPDAGDDRDSGSTSADVGSTPDGGPETDGDSVPPVSTMPDDGCSTAGTPARGASWALLALVALVTGRRRSGR